MSAEVNEKLGRVRMFIEEEDFDGVLLTAQNAVSWVTAGAQNTVIRAVDPGLVWVLITPSDAFVLTQNIEGPRIVAEEGVVEAGFEVRTFDWFTEGMDELIGSLCDLDRLATDGAGPGKEMTAQLQALRLSLTDPELDRLRELGADCCEVMESVASGWAAGITERELAGRILLGLEERGIYAPVLLVGGDERRRKFRHPTVSDAVIRNDVLAVIVGVRDGLNVAMSRSASVGAPDPILAERHIVAATVEAHMLIAGRPGATWGDVLQAGIDAYAACGYPGEWKHHLQGGPIGYGPREFIPTPRETPNEFTGADVLLHQAVAWCPTVQGGKAEDTFIVEKSGPAPVSNSSSWPMIEVEGPEGPFARPAIFEV